MKDKLQASCGAALLTGSLLMIFTMVMHPTGGSMHHLYKVLTMVMVVHSIALFAIPITLFGFWGLTKRLAADEVFSTAAFITICIGMISVMFAAGVNGLALPMFLSHYKDATPQVQETLKPIMVYSGTLNHMFDYIFIGCTCQAVILWSVAILRTKSLPAWLGYLGIATGILSVCLMIAGFVFVDLTGFRVFILLYVIWIILAGVLIRKPGSGS